MQQSLLHRYLLPIATTGLFLVAFVPILFLSYYNHPSAADDYCFADTAVRYGFWQAQQYYYDGWTGRYFSNFLAHGTPLVWGWYAGFKFIPALLAIGWLLAAYTLLGEWLARLEAPTATRRRTQLYLTGLLFFLYILILPNLAEAFIWTASAVVYTVPSALMMYWGAVLLRWQGQQPGTLRTLTGIWASVLVFLIVGCGETHMLLIISLLLAILVFRFVQNRKVDKQLLVQLGVALVSGWLVFRAPGNAIRMQGGATNGDLVGGMVQSLRWLAMTLPRWFIQTPILPLSALWVMIGAGLFHKQTTVNERVSRLFRVPLWYGLLVLFVLLLATVFPSYYATQNLTNRAINVTYAVFLWGWLFILTSQLSRFARFGTTTPPLWLLALTVLWLGVSMVRSLPMRHLYADLLRGDAAQYDRELTARQQLFSQSQADTLRVAPLSVYPTSLFMEDIRTDPTHWWNKCQAGYYGHKVIIIDPSIRPASTRP
ncbi:hypothetical protein J2I47_16665 [Fibrella sp. HMF5335]|uniref:Uncharacterized protein n=1 Tax=Fibrella rubiginis TaxID=2817060 RepID=A0A939GFH7_9BACT|nr:DUF6056 family protein [Fibrella rubiginis]MBO0938187.1 hypothetical protein [Fibrella rubiginis]